MSIPIGTRIPPRLSANGLRQVAEIAQEVGLRSIDLPNLTEDNATVCREYGLRIGTVDVKGTGSLLSEDRSRRQEAVENIRNQISQVASLGATTLFMCLVPENPAQTVQESLSYFIETFPEIVTECELSGMKIALEGWPGPGPVYPTLGYTPEVWRTMFSAIPSSALGLCFDPSHLVRLGIDYLRVLEEFKERIHHCHGKDTQLLGEQLYLYGHLPAQLSKAPDFSEGSWRYCIPGEGEVDWKRVAFYLSEAGYTGCVSIELEDARYWGTVDKELEGIRKAHHYLSTHFQ